MAAYNEYDAKKDLPIIQPNRNVTGTGHVNNAQRMLFESVEGWVEIDTTNTFEDAVPNDPGLFTRGQFICVGVTLIEMTPGNVWTKARMTHISSTQALMIKNNDKQFYTGYTGVDGDNLYAQIGSKDHMNIDQLVGYLKVNLPQLRDDHIWSYTANVGRASSAVSNDGFFGEPSAK